MKRKIKYVGLVTTMLLVAGLAVGSNLVQKNQDIRRRADTNFRTPILANAPDYFRLNVSYVNQEYPQGNKTFEPYQAVHPDVLYLPQGWKGFRYWMSVSPFPNQNPKYEDPHIFASHDGNNWVAPGKNPVVPLVKPEEYEYSDASLLLENDVLYMYYRRNDKNGTQSYEDDTTTMFRIRSADGRNWSQPESTSVLDVLPSGRFASPAVIFENNQYFMFYVDTISQEIRMQSSVDGMNWAGDQAVLSMPGAWHVEAVIYEDYYLMAVNESSQVDQASLYLFASSEKTNWVSLGKILAPSVAGWDSTRIYRSSIVIDNNRFRLWYSAFKDNVVHTGYTEDPSWSLIVDTKPPSCLSWEDVYINQCQTWQDVEAGNKSCITDSSKVTVNLRGTGNPVEMKFYNQPDYSVYCRTLTGEEAGWSTPEPYRRSKSWDLIPGEGRRKVCVMLKSSAGWSEACGADINVQQASVRKPR